MWFDPERLARLEPRVMAAIEDLRLLTSPDPAADHALQICREIALTLSDVWMPMLRELRGLRGFEDPGATTGWEVRFAPRSAGRARSAERRRAQRRARRRLADPVGAALQAWEELAAALHDLRRTLRPGSSPEPLGSVAALDAVTSVLARLAEALRQYPPTVDSPLAHDHTRRVLQDLCATLDPLGLTGMAAGMAAPDDLDAHRRRLAETGRALTSVLDVLIAAEVGDAARRRGEIPLLDMLVHSPGLMALVTPHLDHLSGPSLGALTGSVITRAAAGTHGDRHPPTSPDPFIAHLLGRPGGVAAVLRFGGLFTGGAGSFRSVRDPRAAGTDLSGQLRAAMAPPTPSVALSDPVGSIERRTELLQLLAALSAESENLRIGPLTSRALAVTLAPTLADLAPHLDVRLPVIVTLQDPRLTDGAGSVAGSTTVHIGSYAQVRSVIGALLTDTAGQVALGIAAGQIIGDQAALAARRAVADPTQDVAALAQAHLADARRVLQLLAAARTDAATHAALAHGLAISRAHTTARLIGTQTFGLPGALVGIGLDAALRALNADHPPALPDTGLEASLAMVFTAVVLQLPTRVPALRDRLGLGQLPEEVWDEFEARTEDLDESRAPEDRARSISQIESRIRELPALHAYLNGIRAGSGDALAQ